jgi:hypothetical protein
VRGLGMLDIVYYALMSNPRRLTICLLVVPAVLASGCGSSKTASTNTTASVNAATTTAPANTNTQTASQSTGSTGPQHTNTTPTQKATNATPKTKAPPSHTTAQAPRPRTQTTEPQVSAKRLFPLQFKQNFLAAWTAASGSKSSGECIIAKYQAYKGEKGKALAELVGFELVLNNHLKLRNRLARQYAKECHGAVR